MEDRTFKKVDNSSFKERFQFTFSINENVICQRYFRINGFNYSSIETLELKEVMDECVAMIQKDLVEKLFLGGEIVDLADTVRLLSGYSEETDDDVKN